MALVVFDKAAEAGRPGEWSLDDPAARQQNEAALGFGQFDDLQRNAVGGVGGTDAGVVLVDISDLDLIAGDGLHGAGEPFHLAAILGAGRCPMKREQMTQRLDGHVDLRALLAPFDVAQESLATVIAGALAALRRGAQGSAVDDGGGGFGLAARGQSQHGAPIVHHRPKQPAASQRCVCWYTVAQSGRSLGIHRHGAPVFTM